MSVQSIRIGLSSLALLALISPLSAANLVTNGSFELSNFTVNSEFSPAYGSTSTAVTGWTATGPSAYNIYFFAGTSTTTSALNQWNSNAEKLWSLPNLSQDGGNFIMLDGDTSFDAPITQMISNLTINQTYSLTFDWAAGQLQSKSGATTEQVQFSLGTGVNSTYTTAIVSTPAQGFTEAANNQWFQVTQTFTANATSELLSFMAIGTPVGLPPVVLLDGVSLTATVPEPASIGMLAVGLGAMLVAAKSRFHRR